MKTKLVFMKPKLFFYENKTESSQKFDVSHTRIPYWPTAMFRMSKLFLMKTKHQNTSQKIDVLHTQIPYWPTAM